MEYNIKKGHHRSKPKMPKFWCNTQVITHKIILESSCWYKRSDIPYSGINKIIGYTYLFHGEKTLGKTCLKKYVNSALIGYRPSGQKDRFMLYIYTDHKGVERRTPTGITIKAYEICNVIYYIDKHYIYITINGELVYYANKINICFGYILRPYFGGRSKAPHNMTIHIVRAIRQVTYNDMLYLKHITNGKETDN